MQQLYSWTIRYAVRMHSFYSCVCIYEVCSDTERSMALLYLTGSNCFKHLEVFFLGYVASRIVDELSQTINRFLISVKGYSDLLTVQLVPDLIVFNCQSEFTDIFLKEHWYHFLISHPL